jgi:hypothetical protein
LTPPVTENGEPVYQPTYIANSMENMEAVIDPLQRIEEMKNEYPNKQF